ncbi:MAG: family N-acetyltransferase [Bacteroidetes bacterium]|jgi:GNAT superfamily N-acetyltransferase|nr:family N-acetyltransferase [Bacteroidota bacterium]MDF2451023.1 family N-acetyltransferase [Bacteroidota bacterium]
MSTGTQIGEYIFSTDKNKLNVTYIHRYLSEESYWAKNIPLEIVQKSIVGSFCFGIYRENIQVGFARVITDQATFAYLADVFIDKSARGKGLSKELMKYIMSQDSLKNVRRFMLATLDAHRLYTQFGFQGLKEPDRFMEIKFFEKY